MSYSIIDNCNGCTLCAKVCPTAAITGEKKKLHIINDERCIDCGTCGRACKFESVNDPSGVLCVPEKRALWPKPVASHRECVSCNACESVCPFHCYDMALIQDGIHLYPVLAREAKCVGCGLCADACPMDCIKMVTPKE